MPPNNNYAVHRVTNKRVVNCVTQYLVEWKHTWETEATVKQFRHKTKDEYKVHWHADWLPAGKFNSINPIINYYADSAERTNAPSTSTNSRTDNVFPTYKSI